MGRLRGMLLLSFAVVLASPAQADDEQEAEATKRFQAYAKESAGKYHLQTGDAKPRKLQLREESLLRWSNPLSANKSHGELFLWTDRGRPAAVVSMYEYTDAMNVIHEHHEWCSLAVGGIQATGLKDWSPSAGIEMKPLPGAAAPFETPARRLRQMRDLAAGFSGEKTTRQNETRNLRLLTQPMYRYEPGDPELLDGALFALVEGTDPEVFLLIEARLTKDKPVWHYGLMRMNSVRVAASYGGQLVWEAPTLGSRETYDRQDLPYTAFHVKITPPAQR